ncbi:SMP-30/gluconolactonase/LRE family protein [Streptomyces rubiginosohelvolus]|uniref:SMP-30/gluconolactonase/LRE family protein n=1 Tax=Streptomyces rubiginosohelvolus TaxID=67362 RepID=UPI0034225C9A
MKDTGWPPTGAPGAFYECPRWHEGVWWVSDFYANRIVTVAGDGRTTTALGLDGDHPGGLGRLPGGALLFVAMRARKVMRREPDGSLVVHAGLAPYCEGPANDMLVLPDGTAFVGCFGFDLNAGEHPRTAALLSVLPDGTVRVAAEDLVFPNGRSSPTTAGPSWSARPSPADTPPSRSHRTAGSTSAAPGHRSRRRRPWARPAR